MKQIYLWNDAIGRLNGWHDDYDKQMDLHRHHTYDIEVLKKYWTECCSIQLLDIAELNFEVKCIDDYEDNDQINLYVMSIPQLTPSNFFGGLMHAFRNISEKSKQLIRDEKVTLYVSCDRESWGCDRYMSSLILAIREHGFEHCNIYHSSGNIDFADEWERWRRNNLDIVQNFSFADFFIHDYFETACRYYSQQPGTSTLWSKELRISDEKNKIKDFVCFNKRVRPHRFALYSEISRLNLLDKSMFSFIGEMPWTPYDTEHVPVSEEFYNIIINDIFNNNEEQVNWIDNCINEELFTKRYVDFAVEKEKAWQWQEVGIYDSARFIFDATYFSLISETQFTEVGRFITEKTYRALLSGHPFIVVGQAGVLKHLKQNGYKTYSEMFDESYDTIENNGERFTAIMNTVKDFCSKSDEEKQQAYRAIIPNLEHNQKLFFSDIRKNAWKNQAQHMFAKMENRYEAMAKT